MNYLRLCCLLATPWGIALNTAAQAQDFAWTTNASWTITITGYAGPGGNVTIPDTITGMSVTVIAQEAFYGCVSVTSITVGDSVDSIGSRAFYNCASLTNVTLGDSVLSIGARAFGLCDDLRGVALGASVASIGDDAFLFCTSLTDISVDALNFFFSSLGGVLFNKTQTTLIQYPAGNVGHYTIPGSVTSIGFGAFYYCGNLTGVSIPNSVIQIGANAFGLCLALTRITIPDSVTDIGDGAFYYCTDLTGVHFQGNAPGIGSSVFADANSATIYYLAGTTGWSPTFGGRPAVLWNPQILTTDASFGVSTNGFGFTVTGNADIPVVIEACTNLASADWVSLHTNTLTSGSAYFSDPDWTNYPARFYSIRWP